MDRDGVINKEVSYCHKQEDFEFIDGVFPALRKFQDLGYLLIIVTNQAGIARGYYTNAQYEALTLWMCNKLTEQGIKIARVYHCPHHPDGMGTFALECACRKPKPGMLLQAQRDFDINMEKSILIGDKVSDVEAGFAAGVKRCYLVRTGHNLPSTTYNCPIFDGLNELIKTFV
ncbi:D-glycero-beta-D-manno-heptose 1,7-bisphosphate 7-phosphatase [Undibacterium sp. Ji67W]|uniref:D-glycero-beta-D-manno-heptose 1,7-bisphosphate 7-phosphatase n=1 Tax=Undibacterium sp. Ji67W TaxID=3413042 RepID=UPI003BF2F730